MLHRRSLARLVAAALLLASGVACEDPAADPLADVPPEVNPLAERAPNVKGLALPMPSSIWLVDDATTATGVRVDFAEGSLPTNGQRVTVSPALLARRDGFSAHAPILVTFPGGLRTDGLPPLTRPEASLEASSPTVIVDLATGERVVHFAEVDALAADYPDRQALILRPLAGLEPGHRYAVGLRRTLVRRDGTPPPIAPGFQAILDGTRTSHERLERVRPRYPEIFAALDVAGVPRDDLVLAFDFVTASDETVRADLLGGRDAVLAALAADPGAYGFTVESDGLPEGWDAAVSARRIAGTFEVPLLLTEGGGEYGLLARDGAGRPHVVGKLAVPFVAVVPACVATATGPLPVVIHGHGLLGSLEEVESEYARRAAQHLCMVFVATDLRGMSQPDIGILVTAVRDMNRINLVTEKLVQGIGNFVTLGWAVRGPMAASPAFRRAGGGALLDPEHVYYYGVSQGGIFGGTVLAVDPFLTRGALHVGGANFSLLLERAESYTEYVAFMGMSYPDYLDRQELIYVIQMAFDAVDPAGTYPGLLGARAEPVPGTPPKAVLLQAAVGDAAVSNLATAYAARLAGLPVLEPAVEVPWGLEARPGPLPSALTFFDEHPEPMPPLTNTTNGPNGTHDTLRHRAAVNEQLRLFFTTGEVVQTCEQDGAPVACDCALAETVCGPVP